MRFVIAIFAISLTVSQFICQVDEDSENILFHSLHGLELLLKAERELMLNLENYVNALETKVKLIRSAVAAMRAENLKSADDTETYLANSLNSFALIRRMYADWKHWELFMQSPVGVAEIDINQKLRNNLPSSTDMDIATVAMYRLQTTYDMQPIAMATGLLNGKQYNATLSSRDCFEIGKRLLNQEKIFYSTQWLYAALVLYEENKINAVLGFDKFQIYDLFVIIFLKHHRYETALEIVNIAIVYSPSNNKYLHAKSFIEHNIRTSKEKHNEFITDKLELHYHSCRGSFVKRLKRLHCRYNTTTHPFLKLAPLKMEELHIDPYIVLFYDVISDAEIAYLKEITRPHLRPGRVYNKEHDEFSTHEGKTGQSTFIEDNANNTTKRIMQRITDLSGFDLEGEDMNVMNYIFGAHHGLHHDFFNTSEDAKAMGDVGDRIATVLFYLSDVNQGGSTVFPFFDIVVQPHKGSALMWYNLNNRGEVDISTLHASCPVIVGSKWIATKWIRERPQMFRKPCIA